jgi:hypothetical protein
VKTRYDKPTILHKRKQGQEFSFSKLKHPHEKFKFRSRLYASTKLKMVRTYIVLQVITW